MKLNDYQNRARETAVYPYEDGLTYTALGLCGEAGEVAEKIKKFIRGDSRYEEEGINQILLPELGDVLWYLANLAYEIGYTLEEVAQNNIDKLNKRMKENTIKGSGDDR